MAGKKTVKLPLDGVRVLDITLVWSGPFATMLLADLGAEIIKVESTKHFSTASRGTMPRPPPSAMRGSIGALYPDRVAGDKPWNRCAFFNSHARNKLSMTADLTRDTGRANFEELIKISDIVIENNAAGVMDRLGLGYPVLSKVKQDIIMISMSAFGDTGPYRDYKGFANVVESVAGHTWLRGYPGREPTETGVPVYHMDACAGATAAYAAMVALYHHHQTGEGQFIDMSQAESMLPHFAPFFMDWSINRREQPPQGNRDYLRAPQGCYRCKGQDRWVNVSIGSDTEWKHFAGILGIEDERFSELLNRQKYHDELDKIIEKWTKEREPYEIMSLLQKEGVTCGPVINEADALSDPHLREREFFINTSHPEAGTHPYPGFLWKMSATQSRVTQPPPCLGEHNDYIYRELLGKEQDEIEQLANEGHIGTEYIPEMH